MRDFRFSSADARSEALWKLLCALRADGSAENLEGFMASADKRKVLWSNFPWAGPVSVAETVIREWKLGNPLESQSDACVSYALVALVIPFAR